jgi:ethanolamine utilization protein EutN
VILCRVLGKAVSTRKDDRLTGAKLLIVAEADPDGTPRRDLHVCADVLGAGAGDLVLVTIGSAARMTDETRSQPIDALIVAIVDDVERQA